MTSFRRPEHPDFWLLSQVLIDQDAQAESGQRALEIIGRYLDPPSVAYMANQRALRVMSGRPAAGIVQVSAAWIDGFLAGMAAQHLKTRSAEGDPS
jgi:hypothetical protein